MNQMRSVECGMRNERQDPGKAGPIVDDEAAVSELSALSRNAKLWLMDRIGNRLHVITLETSLGRTAPVHEAADGLIGDMKKIGLFETR